MRLIGIATANLLSAATIRLQSQGLWHPVSHFAFGAQGRVHFIGFSADASRRRKLESAGAGLLAGDHGTTRALIGQLPQ